MQEIVTKDVKDLFETLNENSPEVAFLQKIDRFLKELSEKHFITDDQAEIIDGALTVYILEKQDRNKFLHNIQEQLSLGASEEVAQNISSEIESFIQDSILLGETPDAQIQDEKKEIKNITVSVPTSREVLENLGARLNQSSVIVPSKRDYSIDTQHTEKPAAQQSTPSIDPYRELPEK